MTEPWIAEQEVTRDRAADLIANQFPALAGATLAPLGSGWDNTAWIVDQTWVFRFPRRQLAVNFLDQECRYLPRLAPHLPLPVPVPVYLGKPAGDYPYPFAGYRLLPGMTACSRVFTAAERAATAPVLADFLRCLHKIPAVFTAAERPPGDDIRRTDLGYRLGMLRERLAALAHLEGAAPSDATATLGGGVDSAAIERLAAGLAATPPWTGAPCWLHGDLYARHLLVDDRGTPCGVIDWGDVHVGDPALDLSIAYSFLPPQARSDFFAAYGPVDPDTHDRARFRALFYGVVLLHYGRSVHDAALVAAGTAALAFARDRARL